MNKTFLLNPLRSRVPKTVLVFSIFVVSGLLHELGISFAAGMSYGKPLLYFILQGIGVETERHFKFPKCLVFAWILVPLPLLFPPEFTNLFLGQLGQLISVMTRDLTLQEVIQYSLFVGGLLHALVLGASVQIPGKLNWRGEFQKLQTLNRKVFWTYGGYIFSIIIFMAVVSFIHAKNREFYHPSAFLWFVFIALFW